MQCSQIVVQIRRKIDMKNQRKSYVIVGQIT